MSGQKKKCFALALLLLALNACADDEVESPPEKQLRYYISENITFSDGLHTYSTVKYAGVTYLQDTGFTKTPCRPDMDRCWDFDHHVPFAANDGTILDAYVFKPQMPMGSLAPGQMVRTEGYIVSNCSGRVARPTRHISFTADITRLPGTPPTTEALNVALDHGCDTALDSDLPVPEGWADQFVGQKVNIIEKKKRLTAPADFAGDRVLVIAPQDMTLAGLKAEAAGRFVLRMRMECAAEGADSYEIGRNQNGTLNVTLVRNLDGGYYIQRLESGQQAPPHINRTLCPSDLAASTFFAAEHIPFD